MGCTTSKLDHEDTVRRCKERRRLMKEVVYARHNLAAAHSDYCRSLRLTGSALSIFGAGEPLSVYDHASPILLRTHSSSSTATISMKPPPPASHPHTIPSASSSPPPPPVAAATASNQQNRRKKPIRVPHILSDSSFTSSPTHAPVDYNYNAKANSTYSTTASQSSSAWNWENLNTPSPPKSDYFEQQKNKNNPFPDEDEENKEKSHHNQYQQTHDFDFFLDDDNVSNYSTYSNRPIRNDKNNHQLKQGMFRKINERWDSADMEGETEREEVQCSEWGDRDRCYSTTSSSSDDEEEVSRSRIGSRSNMNGFDAGNKLKVDKEIVMRHKDLAEILSAIKEYFDKAASAGDQVSEILETGRAQLDKSFIKLKRTVYHSSGVFSNLCSSWTSKPPLAVKYKLEPVSLELSGGRKSLCSTLERLLAWEKKLYQEVKAKEGVKIKHEKKLARLQNQEYKGEEEAKLDKTKTSINKLQSLIFVTSQAVSATSSAIIGQRDSELVPQLVELCHAFMYMWRSMNQFHQIQNDIVQQVRSLVNQSTKGESTSNLHRQATRDLESAVSAWHSSFCCLIKYLRDFIRSLHGWFQLSLISVNIEETNSSREPEPSEAFAFSDEWKHALDRVPDTVASEAIKSFINVVHSISLKQIEEFKIRKRTESASKVLEKKTSSVRNIEKKYYNSYSMVGIGLPNTGPDNGHGLDARDPLAEKKLKLTAYQRQVDDEMLQHSKAVEVTRAMTLSNIQTGLPGVFQAMTSFSALFTEAHEAVCKRSYPMR